MVEELRQSQLLTKTLEQTIYVFTVVWVCGQAVYGNKQFNYNLKDLRLKIPDVYI